MNGTDIFVQRGWRCFRHDSGSAYFLHAAEGYLGHAFGAEAAAIAASPTKNGIGPGDASLSAVMAAADIKAAADDCSDGATWELPLKLLGGRILIRFRHERCRDQVAQYFSSSHDFSGSTPDVILECDLAESDRYLFRARPSEMEGTPLEGVRVWRMESSMPEAWTSSQPPFPPLAVRPFKNRFIALHAATLRMPDGRGITILGDRNSGKSSSALHLGNRTGFGFLADETTFIHLRSVIAEPFPQSVGVWCGGDAKKQVPAADLLPRVETRAVSIDQLVVLERDTSASVSIQELSSAETFRALLPHHRDASASLDESMVTLDCIARSAIAVRLRYHDRADLIRSLDEIVDGDQV